MENKTYSSSCCSFDCYVYWLLIRVEFIILWLIAIRKVKWLDFCFLLDGVVPDFDIPVWTARNKNFGMEVVPLNSIHWHTMGIICLQELTGVSLGALGNKRKKLIITYKSKWKEVHILKTVHKLLSSFGVCILDLKIRFITSTTLTKKYGNVSTQILPNQFMAYR